MWNGGGVIRQAALGQLNREMGSEFSDSEFRDCVRQHRTCCTQGEEVKAEVGVRNS